MTHWSGWLSPGATWVGDAQFDGPVYVAGTWKGNLRTSDWVEIAVTGRVEGKVDAAQILICGTLVGDAEAKERITLLPTANVQGSVKAPWVDVRESAQIRATVHASRG